MHDELTARHRGPLRSDANQPPRRPAHLARTKESHPLRPSPAAGPRHAGHPLQPNPHGPVGSLMHNENGINAHLSITYLIDLVYHVLGLPCLTPFVDPLYYFFVAHVRDKI